MHMFLLNWAPLSAGAQVRKVCFLLEALSAAQRNGRTWGPGAAAREPGIKDRKKQATIASMLSA